jgi:hypothetical protein
MLAGRRILRLDGIFELLLASVILVPAASGADMEAAFGLNDGAVIAIGILLVPVGVGLLLAKPDRPNLLALALANALGAGILVAYLAARVEEMNAYGIAVTAVAVLGLVALAGAELRLGLERRGTVPGPGG